MDAEKLKALRIQQQSKRRRTWPLWLILAGVVLISAASAYYAWPRKGDDRRLFKSATAKPTTSGSALPVVTNRPPAVRSGDSVLTVSGYIVNRERIELSPRFLGVVKWIGVRKGDTVTNNQTVVLLDDAEQRARVHEAEGRLASAQVAVEKADLDYQRMKRLIADKIETPQNEDDYRLRLEAARAARKEVEGQVALFKTHLDWTVIRSPADGVVLEKLVDAGELVTPQSFGGVRGPSTAFLAIADLNDLQVEIDLNEADLARVQLNQRCLVRPEAYPDKVYEGYVVEMAPEANRQKGTLQIKVQIRKPDRFLTPELTARVDFLAGNVTSP